MKIGKRITLGFLSVLTLTAIVGITGWIGLSGYASGVDKTQRLSTLVVDLHRLPLLINDFERGDDDGLVKAKQLTDEALHIAGSMTGSGDSSLSLAAAVSQLHTYRSALERYGDLQVENHDRQLAMAETTLKIDENVRQIYDLNYDRYLRGLFILEDLEQQSELRLAFLERANALMFATMAARKSEAEFQQNPTPEAKEQATFFMKEIYLSALSMRKVAKKANEEGEAIKVLSNAVKTYRRRFGQFIDAVEANTNIAEAEQELDQASRTVQTLAEEIAERQKQAFATISDQAHSARGSVTLAFSAATESMNLMNTLLELHSEEKDFFRLRDPAIVNRIKTIMESASNTLTAIAEQATDEMPVMQETLDLLPGYRSTFAAATAASLGQADAILAMQALEKSILNATNEVADQSVTEMARLYDWGRLILGVLCAVALAVGATISLLTGRSITRPLKKLTSSIADLAKGKVAAAIPELDRGDEIGDMARSMGVIRETGAAAVRAQKTLENTEACLMMVDIDGRIAHVNHAFCALADDVRDTLGKELPGFASKDLEGQSFDTFHNEPMLRREKLMQLSSSTYAMISAGGRNFDLKLNPVIDEDGIWIGTVVSWQDRTYQIRLEAEVEALIDAASTGQLGGRLATEHVDGFMLTLSQGMNRLMDTVEGGISSAGDMMSALAVGDLTRGMDGMHHGVFDELRADSDRMRHELSSIATNIVRAGDALTVAAREIASGTSDLTARTQSQSSSVDATSMSMADLTDTVRQNTDSAVEANDIATKTRSAADSGHQVVGQAVKAMEGIQTAAGKITDIVSMIDEIAFQTNLLALNAAVEAARAGEAGKGFAVVASEVRALAQRSAVASGEIKALISDTVDEIGSGVSLVQEVGGGLKEIVGSVNNLADLVSEIAHAGQEQTARLAEASKAVKEMGGMADQNAALAEQTTASVKLQVKQVNELNRLVKFFKIENNYQNVG